MSFKDTVLSYGQNSLLLGRVNTNTVCDKHNHHIFQPWECRPNLAYHYSCMVMTCVKRLNTPRRHNMIPMSQLDSGVFRWR